ncbi:hypothetical protein [Micromonospora sp. NPDC005113]
MDAFTTLPQLDDLEAYMQSVGWLQLPPGAMGTLWMREESTVGVPHHAQEDPDAILGVLSRLAAAENRDVKAVAESARYYRIDVTHLRAANDYRITDTIPLEAAATIINSAKVMVRAVATTSGRERSEIGGNYSERGDRVLQDARMGHTERGSFVIPVLVRLPEETAALPQDSIDGFSEMVTPEPFERRVTRTLAQSMAAVDKLIVEPGRPATLERLIAAVELGVSREFCDALSKVLAERAVGEFEARFDWAPSVRISSTAPRSVTIDADAQFLVQDAAEKLRANKIEPAQTFSGPIIALRHETSDPFGWASVSTVRNTRSCEIRVRLPIDHYHEAVSWHRSNRPVIVTGRIRRDRSRRLFVDEFSRFHPVDDMHLFQ